MGYLILIAGLPGTGKTTFARYLSGKMNVPMASKDILKEHLFDTLGFKNRNEKVALGIAAADILYHFAEIHLEIGQPVILENNFENVSKPGLLKLIEKFKCKTVTVRFQTDPAVLAERFKIRDSLPERHRGHVVNTQYPEARGPGQDPLSYESAEIYPASYFTAMNERGMAVFTVGGPLIIVDTTDFSKISYESIYDEIMTMV